MGGLYRPRGFTIWELMMAITVAGIVLGLAVPSFMEFQRTNAMAAATNDLVTATLLARSEAVKRQAPVTLCTSPDPAAEKPACGAAPSGGFIVFVDDDADAAVDSDEDVLLRRPAPGGTIRVWSDAAHLIYARNGSPRDAAGGAASATRFLLCDDRGNRPASGGSAARVVVIDGAGRGTMRQAIDIVATAAAALGADCE